MEQYITTLLSSLLSLYLPFEDTGTKVACSLALSQILTVLIVKVFNNIGNLDQLYYYFFNERYVIIETTNPAYEKLIDYFYNRYLSLMTGCKFQTQHGKNKMVIDRLSKKDIVEKYKTDEKSYKIRVKFIKDSNEKGQDSTRYTGRGKQPISDKNIVIAGNCQMDILETYINSLIKVCNQKTSNKVMIYNLSVDDKKNRAIRWYGRSTKISKNIKNTIVSDQVKKNFYDDVENFIHNEKYYIDRGLPYKRGYILHGEAGTGKTSLIKAVANEYQLPIFIIDLSILENNNELTRVVSDINHFVAVEQKYLMVLEDVDRCKIFKKRNYWYDEDEKGITDDCILNILDGIDESYGRITTITTNDLSVIKKLKSLIRPGRVDMIVNVTYCTIDQIKKILTFYFGNNEMELEEDIIITPAKLTQLILIFKDCEKIVKLLNKQKDLRNIDTDYLINLDLDKIDEVEIKNEESDKEDEDKEKMNYTERMIKKNMVLLEKYKLDLEKLEKYENNMSEKEKLMYQKKVITTKLLEMKINDKKEEYALRKKKMNIKINKSDLGLDKLLASEDEDDNIEDDNIEDDNIGDDNIEDDNIGDDNIEDDNN